MAQLTKEARKMGCAVEQIDAERQASGRTKVKSASVKIAEVPGKQTVPRAEL